MNITKIRVYIFAFFTQAYLVNLIGRLIFFSLIKKLSFMDHKPKTSQLDQTNHKNKHFFTKN